MIDVPVTKHVGVSVHTPRCSDQVVDARFGYHVEAPQVQAVHRPIEEKQVQCIDCNVDVPVVELAGILPTHDMQNTVEVPKDQSLHSFDDVLPIPPVDGVAPVAEVFEVDPAAEALSSAMGAANQVETTATAPADLELSAQEIHGTWESPEDLAAFTAYESAFVKLDVHQNGRIARKDFQRILLLHCSPAQFEDMMESLDLKEDSLIAYNVFLLWIKEIDVGDSVLIRGLTSNAGLMLNGKTGVVCSCDAIDRPCLRLGVAVVGVDDPKSIRLAHLAKFDP